MPFLDKVKTLLDRRGLRFALVPMMSHLARSQGHGVKRIFYDRGIWIHETSRGYFAYHQPYVRLDMSHMDEAAQAHFFWGYKPQAGDVVMDVGAGVGEETLTFSRAVGERGKVICIEAHPRTYRCLEKLVQYNALANVIAVHRAAAEPLRSTAIIEDSDEYLNNRSSVSKGISVPAATIDAMHQSLGLGRVHFLEDEHRRSRAVRHSRHGRDPETNRGPVRLLSRFSGQGGGRRQSKNQERGSTVPPAKRLQCCDKARTRPPTLCPRPSVGL